MENIQNSSLSMANRSMAARLAAAVAGLALLLSPPGAAMAQTLGTIGTETLTIDFETVPGGTPSEGLAIDTQFEATTGISFSLDGGASPVIAQVGAPATAFKGPPGNTGNDNVVSGPDVGQFFLTDDGVISAGNPPNLIITFSNPVSSVRGVVIDVDFDESFVFEARNSLGAVLRTVSLAAGDAGTGNGFSSPWEVDQGANEISSLHIIGSRLSGGGFGLAFDNLVAFELIEGVVFNAVDLANGSVDFSPGDSFFDAPPTFDLSSPMEQSPAQQAALTRLFNQLQPTSMAGEFEEPPGRELEPVAEGATYAPPLEVEVAAGAADQSLASTPPRTEQFDYQNIADLINASLNPDFRDPAAQPEEPSVSELSEAEAQQLSAEFARDLEQYLQDQIQRDLYEALGIQNQIDMNNYIESVIPELAAIVVL